MWAQLFVLLNPFLLAVYSLFELCGQSFALPSQEKHKSSFDRRGGVLAYSVANPWPKQGQIYPIPYCFKPSGSKDNDNKVAAWFSQAILLWEKPPIITEEKLQFTLPIKYQKQHECPSTAKHDDILIVSITDGDQIFTTLGYQYKQENTMEIGKKFLDINTADTTKVHKRIGRIAHELGRSMGLPNENQVNIEYFKVICTNLQGYANIVKTYSNDVAIQACNDIKIARQIKWREAMQLAPYNETDQISTIIGPVHTWETGSIMCLTTGTFGLRSRVLGTRQNVLLLKKGIGVNSDRPVPVDWYRGPSSYDLRALLTFYNAVEALQKLEQELDGEPPLPLYDSSSDGSYDNQDALFEYNECEEAPPYEEPLGRVETG